MVKIKDDSTIDTPKDTTLPFATTNNTTMSDHTIDNYPNNTLYNRRRNSLLLSGIFLVVILGVLYNQGDNTSVITDGVSNNGHNVLRGLINTKQQVRLLDEWESEDDDDDIATVEDITAEASPVAGGGEDDEEEEAELSAVAKAAISTEMLDEEAIAALDEDGGGANDSVPTEDLSQPVDETVNEGENEEDEDRFDIKENEEAATAEESREEALSNEQPIDTATELEQTTPEIGDLEDEIVSAAESTTENNVESQEESSTESSVSVEEEDQSEFDEEIDKESEEIFDEIEAIDEEIEGMYKKFYVMFLVVQILIHSIENIMV